MPRTSLLLIALLILVLSACRAEPRAAKIEPAQKEKLEESGLYRLTLTDRAVERLDVQTAEVTRDRNGKLLIPYSALIYDLTGQTWAYTSPAPHVYVREVVTVDAIVGDHAILTAGPQAGTLVVSVAAAELYGAETGIGK